MGGEALPQGGVFLLPGSIARFFMRVSNIVISVPLLSPNDTIGTALTVMQAKNVDIAPVADRLGGPVGAITRRGLLSALGNGSPISGAIDGLTEGRVSRLSPDDEVAGIPGAAVPALVLDEDGELAGVVSGEAYAEALQACITEFREQVSSIMNS